jgi:hypothetical protein
MDSATKNLAARHRPCDGTPIAATISLATGRVTLLSSKNIIFIFILHSAVHGDSETLPVVTAPMAALGVPSHVL